MPKLDRSILSRRETHCFTRKRCGAWVKNLIAISENGVRSRSPRCRNWAMANGRCRVHGGASTGPRTEEGKARVVAAMVEGRRKWIERLHAEGKRAPGGRRPRSQFAAPSRLTRAARAARLKNQRQFSQARAQSRKGRKEILESARRWAAKRQRRDAERRAVDEYCLSCLAEIDAAEAIRMRRRLLMGSPAEPLSS